ncbi:MAG TPA: DUF1127 domain-containing protein [Aestuariivirgaceae bacterium]|nr:DUF1127 domain-containing protein [Aestuariivirgaceae bacterium]
MNAAPQTRPATPRPASRLARVRNWVRRIRANARARRSLGEVDARTLRDIGITRGDLALLRVRGSVGSNSR